MKVLCVIQGLLLLVTKNCVLVTGGSMQWNQIERGKNKYVNTDSNVIMKQCWKNVLYLTVAADEKKLVLIVW